MFPLKTIPFISETDHSTMVKLATTAQERDLLSNILGVHIWTEFSNTQSKCFIHLPSLLNLDSVEV